MENCRLSSVAMHNKFSYTENQQYITIYIIYSHFSLLFQLLGRPLCTTELLVFVLQISGVFRIRVYERPDFGGQMLECTEDLSNLPDRWHLREVHSAQVQDGAWVFYELPNYHGRQYLLERGEYRRFTEWAAMNPTVGSFRRVQNFQTVSLLVLVLHNYSLEM